jgi:zinc transport system ATP-binding protein
MLKIQDICFGYDANNLVLDRINLDIEKGEFVALIGPNGGGKSTLVKLLLGLLSAKSGSMQLFGGSIADGRSRVGYLPQYAHLDFSYPITVGEVVRASLMAGNPWRKRQKNDQLKLQETLEEFSLSPLQNRPLSDLSGGQRQRVFLARAMIHDPELLILDEPTTALDAKSENHFYHWLQGLVPQKTVILVSHDLSVVSRIATKVCCLNKTLVTHASGESFSPNELDEIYPCAVEFFAHGHPHRVVGHHHHG